MNSITTQGNILNKYHELIDKIEEEISIKIDINQNNLEKLLVTTVVGNLKKQNPNSEEYQKGFKNEVLKNKGKATLIDFYTSFLVSGIKKQELIFINEVQKRKISQKNILSICLEYHNLPALLGCMYSGQLVDFDHIINNELKELEVSIDKINYNLNNYNWKDNDFLTKFFNNEDTSDIDKLNLITTIASREFSIPLKELSTLIYGFGLLGYYYNNKTVSKVEEDELVLAIRELILVISSEDFLLPLFSELNTMDPYLFSKVVTIID
jgi:hypothetical protein